MSLTSSVKGTILAAFLKHLAASEPKTTIAGFVLGAIVASKIDYSKLLAGDPNEIGNAVAACVAAVLGYYSNNKKSTSTTTPI